MSNFSPLKGGKGSPYDIDEYFFKKLSSMQDQLNSQKEELMELKSTLKVVNTKIYLAGGLITILVGFLLNKL